MFQLARQMKQEIDPHFIPEVPNCHNPRGPRREEDMPLSNMLPLSGRREELFHLYFRHANPFLPAIHRSSFEARYKRNIYPPWQNIRNAVLVLLVCAVGALYESDIAFVEDEEDSGGESAADGFDDGGHTSFRPPPKGHRFFAQAEALYLRVSLYDSVRLEDLQIHVVRNLRRLLSLTSPCISLRTIPSHSYARCI